MLDPIPPQRDFVPLPPQLPRCARTHMEQYGSLRALRALGPTGPSPRDTRRKIFIRQIFVL